MIRLGISCTKLIENLVVISSKIIQINLYIALGSGLLKKGNKFQKIKLINKNRRNYKNRPLSPKCHKNSQLLRKLNRPRTLSQSPRASRLCLIKRIPLQRLPRSRRKVGSSFSELRKWESRGSWSRPSSITSSSSNTEPRRGRSTAKTHKPSQSSKRPALPHSQGHVASMGRKNWSPLSCQTASGGSRSKTPGSFTVQSVASRWQIRKKRRTCTWGHTIPNGASSNHLPKTLRFQLDRWQRTRTCVSILSMAMIWFQIPLKMPYQFQLSFVFNRIY